MGYQRELETSVHMRLYSLKKMQIFLLVTVLSCIILISAVIGSLGPPVLSRNTHFGSQLLPTDRTLVTGFYKIHSDPVLLYQKELWLSAVIHQSEPPVAVSLPLTTTVSVMCRSYSPQISKTGTDDADPELGEVISIEKYQKNITLVCGGGQACNEFQLIHLASLNCSVYTFKVKLQGLPSATVSEKASEFDDVDELQEPRGPAFEVAEIEFITQTHNTSFSYFELLSRFVAFLGAFALLVTFSLAMRPFEYKHWTIEQRWTIGILVLLIFFYNPLHSLAFLLRGWIPQALDSFFQVSFYSGLLLFWLCVFDGLRVSQRTCCGFYCLRLLLTGVIWLTIIAFNGWLIHSEHTDPLFALASHATAVKVFVALLGVLAFIYLLCFLILLFRSYSELRDMPYYGTRLCYALAPIFLVVIDFFVVAGLRFRPSGTFFYRPVTTDLVVFDDGEQTPSGIAFTLYRSAFELSFSFGILFVCMLILVVAYSPAESAFTEANFLDDPNVSMAYDSDEDVLYGSDRDDIHLRGSIRNR
uniref:Lipase_3 domain-containing protein n=1 Tax=Mesocestoides corti TaxID=53468 RepID=A0A5K3FV73_MESCO